MNATRLIASLMCIVLAASCSRAVLIPPGEAASAEYRNPGSYRIRLKGWNEYYARRFSVTDSTVVIHELQKFDDRYKRMRHEMPITIPSSEVVSISEMEANRLGTTVLVVSAVLVVAFIIAINTVDLSIE